MADYKKALDSFCRAIGLCVPGASFSYTAEAAQYPQNRLVECRFPALSHRGVIMLSCDELSVMACCIVTSVGSYAGKSHAEQAEVVATMDELGNDLTEAMGFGGGGV